MPDLNEKWADCIAVLNKGLVLTKQITDSVVNIKQEENADPVVSGANVVCDQMVKGTGTLVQVVCSSPSHDERNGNEGLKDTDIKLIPMSFGMCKVINLPCRLKIAEGKWMRCYGGDTMGNQPSVRMYSFMVCQTGQGRITPINNGQSKKTVPI